MEGGAPPPIETVCAAIETLYHNPDPREKERASNWLQDLQKSVFAWKVSTSIITEAAVIYCIAYKHYMENLLSYSSYSIFGTCRLPMSYYIEKEQSLLRAATLLLRR